MAWTAPRTWVVGEIVTAAQLNTHIRDNESYLKGIGQVPTIQSGLIVDSSLGTEYLTIPRLTTTQRDALTPTAGMMIYNTTTTQFNKYENGAWRADLGFNSHHGDLSGLTDDDHTQYQKESEKDAASGYAGLNASSDIAESAVPEWMSKNKLAWTLNKMLLGGGAGANPTEADVPTITAAYKAADESVAGSATLQNDDALYFAVTANEKVGFTMCIFCVAGTTNASYGIKHAFSIPTGGSITKGYLWGETNAGADTDGTAVVTDVNPTTTIKAFMLRYIYIGGANAGNVQWQWAQTTAAADYPNTVKANSYIIAHRLA